MTPSTATRSEKATCLTIFGEVLVPTSFIHQASVLLAQWLSFLAPSASKKLLSVDLEEALVVATMLNCTADASAAFVELVA